MTCVNQSEGVISEYLEVFILDCHLNNLTNMLIPWFIKIHYFTCFGMASERLGKRLYQAYRQSKLSQNPVLTAVPWSSLEGGDEQLDRPNSQTTMQVLGFNKNTTAFCLGRSRLHLLLWRAPWQSHFARVIPDAPKSLRRRRLERLASKWHFEWEQNKGTKERERERERRRKLSRNHFLCNSKFLPLLFNVETLDRRMLSWRVSKARPPG